MKQVSIFAENVKGAMRSITAVLHENGVNIMGMVTNDSAEYGIIRMVVDEPEKAVSALKDKGYTCKTQTVIGVEIADKVGALDELLGSLYDSNININYIYISYNRETAAPIIILHTEDIAEVESCLKSSGFKVC